MAKSYILEQAIKEVWGFETFLFADIKVTSKQISAFYFLLGFLRSIVSFVGSASD